MNRTWVLVFLALHLISCGTEPLGIDTSPAQKSEDLIFASEQDQTAGKVAKHSYIVAFRNMLEDGNVRFGSFHSTFRAHALALQEAWAKPFAMTSARFLSTLDLNDLSASFSPRSTFSGSPWLLRKPAQDPSLASLMEVSFRSEAEAVRTLSEWYDKGKIWYAEPNYQDGGTSGELEDSLIRDFSDTGGNTLWLDQINFVQALEELKDIPDKISPIVAVMDSGVDVKHDKLKDSIFLNTERQNKLCRDDLYGCNTTKVKADELGKGNVYPVGTQGFGQACSNLSPTSKGRCEHGTHVAGIVAARNSDKYTGVCPYCRILVVSVVDISQEGGKEAFVIPDAAILAGLAYVSGFKENGQPLIRVINASFGKFERSRSVELFVRAMRQFGRGTLIVAAAGNEDTMKRQYPAAFEDVISVANVENDVDEPRKAASSNFGMWVDIAAPGDGKCPGKNGRGVLSTYPGNDSDCKVGTSMAAPVVAGVAGLLLVQNPSLTADQLEARLKDTAIPDLLYKDGINNNYRPTIKGKVVPLLGSGVVNALAALRPQDDLSPSVATDREERVQPGCGVIGGRQTPASAFLLLLLPLSAVLWRRRRF